MIRRAILATTLAFFLACQGSNSPTAPNEHQFGRLSGTVTIGPNCPAETTTNPCPPPPGAYDLRKVLVYDATHTTLLYTVDIDSHGFYAIDLLPADYTIDIKKAGLDRSSDVPAKVTIRANQPTTFNINIDTGVR